MLKDEENVAKEDCQTLQQKQITKEDQILQQKTTHILNLLMMNKRSKQV